MDGVGWGTTGFEGRFDYAAINAVSDVASRQCDEAKPGKILVTLPRADEGREYREGRVNLRVRTQSQLTHPGHSATILLSCTNAALIPNNRHLIQLKGLRFSLRVPQPHEYPIAINYRPNKHELDPRKA